MYVRSRGVSGSLGGGRTESDNAEKYRRRALEVIATSVRYLDSLFGITAIDLTDAWRLHQHQPPPTKRRRAQRGEQPDRPKHADNRVTLPPCRFG